MACDLSVIIVNWNTKDFLKNCINSIKENTKKIIYEIIVIDNFSSDGSPRVVEADFPDVTLIKNQENFGFGHANNQGYAMAKGKYILFLNSDMIVQKNCLKKMFDFMEKNPAIGASSCKLTHPDGSLQHSCREFPSFKTIFLMQIGVRFFFPKMKIFRDYLMLDWDHSDIREIDQIMGSFMFIRGMVIKEVGGFDERFWMYFEEVDLCLRIKAAGWKIVHYPYVSSIHFLSKSSDQWGVIKRIREFQKSSLKYFKKNGKYYEYCVLLTVTKIKYLFFSPIIKLIKKGQRK